MKKVIKILFVCHGNICRSTMAQSYFTWLADQSGLSYMFEIDSAATSREEIGNGPHRGTEKVLRQNNIPLIPHRARQMTIADAQYYNLLIGMDEENIWCMRRLAKGQYADKMHMLLDFDKDGNIRKGREVADPWYTGDFESTFRDVEKGCANLLEYCRRLWKVIQE